MDQYDHVFDMCTKNDPEHIFSIQYLAGRESYLGIHQVRERAGLQPLSGLSQEVLRQAIIQERAFELCFEGHAYFDYQRQGVLEERAAMVGHTNVEPFRHVYPIPQEAMDRNPGVEQNH